MTTRAGVGVNFKVVGPDGHPRPVDNTVYEGESNTVVEAFNK